MLFRSILRDSKPRHRHTLAARPRRRVRHPGPRPRPLAFEALDDRILLSVNAPPEIITMPITQLFYEAPADPDAVLTIPGTIGQSVSVTFQWEPPAQEEPPPDEQPPDEPPDPFTREIEFGMYRVSDNAGRVDDVPSDSFGYLQTALDPNNARVIFSYDQSQQDDDVMFSLAPGEAYAFYLIAGGSSQDFLNGSSDNPIDAFFSLPSLNEDGDVLTANFVNNQTILTWIVEFEGDLRQANFSISPALLSGVREIYTYLTRAVDPDGDTLTYSLTNSPLGAVIDPQTGDIAWLSQPGQHDFTVRVEDGCEESDTQDFMVTVTQQPVGEIRGTKFADRNGNGQRDLLPPLDGPPGPITLIELDTGFPSPIGIDYHEPTESLVASINYLSGTPETFRRIDAAGSRFPFSNVTGFTEEVKIASVRSDGNGPFTARGFKVGDLFVGNGVQGQIVRLSDNGDTVFSDPAWVDLNNFDSSTTDHGRLRGSLYVDRTGVFGGDLIVVTTKGEVWRIGLEVTDV